jgi:hypothetical protein
MMEMDQSIVTDETFKPALLHLSMANVQIKVMGLDERNHTPALRTALALLEAESHPAISLILAHFPVVIARLALAWVDPWMLAQLREMAGALPRGLRE